MNTIKNVDFDKNFLIEHKRVNTIKNVDFDKNFLIEHKSQIKSQIKSTFQKVTDFRL